MKTDKDGLPQVAMRIPGPWRTEKELIRAVNRVAPRGCRASRGQLKLEETSPLWLGALPSDDQFPRIFEISSRRSLSKSELKPVTRYRMNAAVVGSGGSIAAAQRLLAAGDLLIQAGGAGVFVDNSLMSHSGSDWQELARNSTEPLAVFYAFVNIIRRTHAYESHGMHVVGHRDGFVEVDRGENSESLKALEDFLRDACCQDRQWAPHDVFKSEEGHSYMLAAFDASPWDLFGQDHPTANPYGKWKFAKTHCDC